MTAADSTVAEVPLDDVMLAMDVVDTLRHQRSLVDAELDEEVRARELRQRVQQIYASQGIEVADEVIAEAVEALAQDRFVYRPAERTLAVRLAEIYVERGKWCKRTAVAVAALVVLWLAVTIPPAMARRAAVDAFARRVADYGGQLLEARNTADQLVLDLDRARAAAGSGARAGPADPLLDAVSRDLEAARADLQALAGPDDLQAEVASYPAAAQALDADLAGRQSRLVIARTALGAVSGQLQVVARLRDVGGQLERVVAQVAQLAPVDEARQEAARLEEAVRGALRVDDLDTAQRELGRLEELVAVLGQSYELRIVSRGGARSGVWRQHSSLPGVRNYYIVVEAVDGKGRTVALSITNEENQQVRRVERFGVRVPESVYERVKADKLDNGIIDEPVVGAKRRGALRPEYRIDVLGGMITEW